MYISVSYFESIKPKIESFVSQKLSIVLLNFLSSGPASQPRCLSSISLLMLKWRLYQQLRREIKKFQLLYYKYQHFYNQSTISHSSVDFNLSRSDLLKLIIFLYWMQSNKWRRMNQILINIRTIHNLRTSKQLNWHY